MTPTGGRESSTDSPTDKRFNLTICSANGATWTTDQFGPDTTVERVIEDTLNFFRASGALRGGRYRLALIVYGYDNPAMDEQTVLAANHVTNGSMLRLVPAQMLTNA